MSEDWLVFSPYLYGNRISWKVVWANNMNREDGVKLSKTWKPLIHLLKVKKQQFNALQWFVKTYILPLPCLHAYLTPTTPNTNPPPLLIGPDHLPTDPFRL